MGSEDRGSAAISRERARELARELLESTSWVDGHPVATDADRFVVGCLQRCRHLARAFLVLYDDQNDQSLEQEILLRTLLEFVITLSWMLDSPDERLLLLQWDEATRIEVIVWDLDVLETQPTTEMEWTGVAQMKAKIEWAWRKLGRPDRLPKRIPSLEQRAGGAGREIYALVYRHQSRVAAHPGAAAVRPLVAGVEGGGQVIHDRVLDPPSVNPAGSALALLWYAFSAAQEKHAALPPTEGLDVIGRALGVED